MDVDLAESLPETVFQVTTGLLGVPASVVHDEAPSEFDAPFELSSVIGITGSGRCALVVSLPVSLARRLAMAMLGVDHARDLSTDDLYDGVAEFANVIGGNLLTMLQGVGPEPHLSLPAVVVGPHRVMWRYADQPSRSIVFETPTDRFVVSWTYRRTTSEPSALKHNRFLIADDSRLMRRLVRRALTDAGYGACAFVEVGNGLAAIRELEDADFAFDAAFIDLHMPVQSGREVLEWLGEHQHLERVPVIVITSDRKRDVVQGMGVRALVTKPFTAETLGAAVREVVLPASAEDETP